MSDAHTSHSPLIDLSSICASIATMCEPDIFALRFCDKRWLLAMAAMLAMLGYFFFSSYNHPGTAPAVGTTEATPFDPAASATPPPPPPPTTPPTTTPTTTTTTTAAAAATTGTMTTPTVPGRHRRVVTGAASPPPSTGFQHHPTSRPSTGPPGGVELTREELGLIAVLAAVLVVALCAVLVAIPARVRRTAERHRRRSMPRRQNASPPPRQAWPRRRSNPHVGPAVPQHQHRGIRSLSNRPSVESMGFEPTFEDMGPPRAAWVIPQGLPLVVPPIRASYPQLQVSEYELTAPTPAAPRPRSRPANPPWPQSRLSPEPPPFWLPRRSPTWLNYHIRHDGYDGDVAVGPPDACALLRAPLPTGKSTSSSSLMPITVRSALPLLRKPTQGTTALQPAHATASGASRAVGRSPTFDPPKRVPPTWETGVDRERYEAIAYV